MNDDSKWFCHRVLRLDRTEEIQIFIGFPYIIGGPYYPKRPWTCDIKIVGFDVRADVLELYEPSPLAALSMALTIIYVELRDCIGEERLTWLGGASLRAAFPRHLPDPGRDGRSFQVLDRCKELLKSTSSGQLPSLNPDIRPAAFAEPKNRPSFVEEIALRDGSVVKARFERPFMISPHSWGCVLEVEGFGLSNYLYRLNERPCGYDSIDAFMARTDLLAELIEPHLCRINTEGENKGINYCRRRYPSFLPDEDYDRIEKELEAYREGLYNQF